MDMAQIGERIKKRRLELGLTQTQIKEICGIGSGHMSEIENGKKLPAANSLYLLSKALECSIDWILIGDSHNCDISPPLSNEQTYILELFSNFGQLEKKELIELLEFKVSKLKKKGKSFHSGKSIKEENGSIEIA